MIKRKLWIFGGAIFILMIGIIVATHWNNVQSNKGASGILENKDETKVKIGTIKSIDIYDLISSNSHNNAHITDLNALNKTNEMFEKVAFEKCIDSPQTPSLYVKFSSTNSEISFFIFSNDIVDINGTKYKSVDVTYDMINKLYQAYK